jgi:hypothetical protein
MRGAMAALAALVLIAAGPARADRVLDGYWWTTQTDEGQLIYVMGLSDGLPLGARFAAGPDATAGTAYIGAYNHYVGGVPNPTLRSKLGTFYSDPQNLKITLPDAVMAVLKGLAGDPDTDAFIARLRAPPPAP